MMFFDIVVWLAVAKVIVVLLEDSAYAVRGKVSPRQRERAQHQAAEAAGRAVPKAAGGLARTRAAAGGYLAGVVEDATANARARRRRAQARKRGARAVDGVFVDIDDSDGFHADCDLCGWSSRPYRIEANALGAGREHTRTEHPDVYHPDPEPGDNPASQDDGAGQQDQPHNPEQGGNGEQGDDAQPGDSRPDPAATPDPAPGGRPKLRVIPGGQQDEQQPGPRPRPQTGEAQPRPSEAENDSGPQSPQQWQRERQLIRESAMDLLRVQGRCIEWDDSTRTFCRAPVDEVEGAEQCRYHRMQEHMQQQSVRGRCIQPGAGENGLCGAPVEGDTEACAQHQGGPNSVRSTWGHECQACGEQAEGFASQQAARDDAAGHRCPTPSQDPTGASSDAPGDPAGKTPANETGAGIPADATTKENTVNLEATGPEEIRTAFATSAEVCGEKAEELAGLAGVLVEAADRYEGMKMAGSTVEHLREAGESLQAAKASMDTAGEQLQAALADFNARDGQVADTVADTGGNVASEEVLVGG